MPEHIDQLISGFLVTAYFVAGLFFLKFWRASRDRLFAIFSAAFWILGLQRLLLAVTSVTDENSTYLYVVRLAAFLLIIYAIIDKNRVAKAR